MSSLRVSTCAIGALRPLRGRDIGVLLLIFLAGCSWPSGGVILSMADADDHDATWTIERAHELAGSGRVGEAYSLLCSFEGRSENQARCLEAAGVMARDLGQPSLAASYLKQAVCLQPENPRLLLILGETLLDAGMERKAETALRECLGIDWNREHAKILLAEIALCCGTTEQAAAILETVATGYVWDAHALLLSGTIHQRSGEPKLALECFDRAASADSSLCLPHFNKGCVLEDLGNRAAAEEAYRQALLRSSHDVPALFNLGRLLVASGRHDQGRVLIDKACSLEQDSTRRRSIEQARRRLLE